jgi:acyl carrier protein
MTTDAILDGLAEIVWETTRIPRQRVAPERTFRDDLDIDSLSMVEIATAAEDRFGVTIPDDELGRLLTVGDAVAYIERASTSA